MRRTLLVLAALLLALAFPMHGMAAVFQYTVNAKVPKQVKNEKGEMVERIDEAPAFLWIPPQATQVRGIVVGGMTLMERECVRDPIIRKACADEQLALLFFKTGLLSVNLQQVLDDLAALSGYRELSVAPLFFIGHSAGGPQAKAMAVKMADRCFGMMQYRGGVAGPGSDAVPPGIPTLAMVGQFDEFGGLMRDANGFEGAWERGRNNIQDYRAANPAHLASLLVEAGAGHFAWSEGNAQYLALFLRKAAQARIPKSWPTDAAAPVALLPIDPATGWLTDMDLKSPGKAAPAPHDQYKGDKTRAAWHFDEEIAKANVAFHARLGKKDQFIKWSNPTWVDAGVRHFFTTVNWVTGDSFEVNPVYRDTYPQPEKSGGPRWLQPGEPVGHSSAPIRIRTVAGPVVPVGVNTFRFQYDALAPVDEGGRVTFMAYSVGDAQYRHTEQVGMLPRGFKGITAGKDQIITFPPLPNLRPNAGPVDLKATSDSGRPVEYYVAQGPAIIDNGKLKLAEIPARATFPITIKIVAYQSGWAVDPKFKAATPVEQTIKIEKP